MNIRNDKGITLIVETITVLLLTLIMSIISYSSKSSLQVRKLNDMYSDIVSIQDKAANYYLKYGKAPVTEEKVSETVINQIKDEKNPNDAEGEYYKVDISSLNNITLNNKETSDNYYFMNKKTLTTYYSKGFKINNKVNDKVESKTYHTLPSNYVGIQKLEVNKYQD